ncbi:MAG TPA: tripartite tricarboxylate transporter TctB family protein [Candidatus Methylomirabilis sp.]|nr:tripartite tricarboxylate transporter TctB family protein [Candidatus Methylomirabilis sp.]
MIGLLLLGLSAGIFWLSREIPAPPFVPLTPAFFPRVLAALLALLAVLLVARGLRSRAPAGAAGRRAPFAPALLVFGSLAAYLLLTPRLGFFTATFLFVFGLGFALSPRRGFDLGGALGLAAGTTALCYVAFTKYLHVLVPEGLFR